MRIFADTAPARVFGMLHWKNLWRRWLVVIGATGTGCPSAGEMWDMHVVYSVYVLKLSLRGTRFCLWALVGAELGRGLMGKS